MSKTFSQSGLKFQFYKQRLNDHQICKRRETLLLETKPWNLVDTARDLCFTIVNFIRKDRWLYEQEPVNKRQDRPEEVYKVLDEMGNCIIRSCL